MEGHTCIRLLRFFEGKDRKPISRLPSGKIVLINRYSNIFPRPGEIWECRIEERDRYAIATPIRKILPFSHSRVKRELNVWKDPPVIIEYDELYEQEREIPIPPSSLHIEIEERRDYIVIKVTNASSSVTLYIETEEDLQRVPQWIKERPEFSEVVSKFKKIQEKERIYREVSEMLYRKFASDLERAKQFRRQKLKEIEKANVVLKGKLIPGKIRYKTVREWGIKTEVYSNYLAPPTEIEVEPSSPRKVQTVTEVVFESDDGTITIDEESLMYCSLSPPKQGKAVLFIGNAIVKAETEEIEVVIGRVIASSVEEIKEYAKRKAKEIVSEKCKIQEEIFYNWQERAKEFCRRYGIKIDFDEGMLIISDEDMYKLYKILKNMVRL